MTFIWEDGQSGRLSTFVLDQFDHAFGTIGRDHFVVRAVECPDGNRCEIFSPAFEIGGNVFRTAFPQSPDNGSGRCKLVRGMSGPDPRAVSAHAVTRHVDTIFIDGQRGLEMSKESIEVV